MPRCVPIEEDEDCGVFMFANEATGECEKCSRNCLDCHGTATACKMCDPVT